MTPIVFHLSFLGLILAIPLGLAIKTLLAIEGRVIIRLLRIRTDGQVNRAVTHQREEIRDR